MKRLLLTLSLFIAPAALPAQTTDDPVIMKINGTDVHRSEFEYSYNKNKAAGTSVADYVDLYINYRLKIQEARKQKLDTAEAFKKEYDSYRDGLLRKYLTDEAFEDSVARSIYNKIKAQVGDSDILRVAHIYIMVQPKATERQKEQAKAKIDSIYGLLKNGADFAETAKKYSQDYNSARNGGELPEFGPGATLKEWEEVCYSLQPGQMSEPFQTRAGYHIVLMKSRNKLEPYEERKEQLIEALNKQGLQKLAFNSAVQKRINQSGGKLTKDQVLDQVLKEHEADDPGMKNLIRDYYDGLLVFEVSKRNAWDPAETDTLGIEKYFKKHKKDYKWDIPRFKGFIIHTSDESLIKEVKKLLKKYEHKNWNAELKKRYTDGKKLKASAVYNIWKEGDNKIVDKYIFDKPDIKIAENKARPYVGLQGRILKKGPEELADVRAQVVSDYQDYKEKEWLNKLRAASKIEVFDDVVKTVNNH